MKKEKIVIMIVISMIITLVPIETFATNVNMPISSVTASKTKITAKWKKLSKNNQKKVSGFQLMYAKNEDFSDGETIDINNNSATYREIFDLEGNTKYYLQLRTKNGEEYSDWSKLKSITTPKEDFITILTPACKYVNTDDCPDYVEIGGGFFWDAKVLKYSDSQTGTKKTLIKGFRGYYGMDGITDGHTVYYSIGKKIKSTTIEGKTKTLKTVNTKHLHVLAAYNNCLYYTTRYSKNYKKTFETLYKINLKTKKVSKITTKYQFGDSTYGQNISCVKSHKYYMEGVWPEGVYNVATNTYTKMPKGVPLLLYVSNNYVTYDIHNWNDERKSMIYRYTFRDKKNSVLKSNAYLRWINMNDYGYTYY